METELTKEKDIKIFDHNWIYDKVNDVYTARRQLIVDENVRNAAKKSGIELHFSTEKELVLTPELCDNFSTFIDSLKPNFTGYRLSVPTFEEYVRNYEWSMENDEVLWKNIGCYLTGEIVEHKCSYGKSYGIVNHIGDEPELDFPIDLSLFSDFISLRVRLAQRRSI